MKVEIAQIILESANFRHIGDYLGTAPNTPHGTSEVSLGMECLRPGEDRQAFFVRLTAKTEEGAKYQFEVSYGLVGRIALDDGETLPEDIDHRLIVTGSAMLYPFVREVVANLSSRGRFGPTWLAPKDFSTLQPPVVTAIGNAPNAPSP